MLELDLQRLLDVRVSSATRREEAAFTLPTAMVVLTRDDIRRSGHRLLPELLRDVPGLHVGRWDGNKWAVSARNALSRFASTLLVMIDGRPVYTPLTGGVRWEAVQLLLDDIERIEIVLGPGGPLWGANAVDGVISVVTRSAQSSQGALLDGAAGHGGELRRQLGMRWGGQLAPQLHWRLSALTQQHEVGRYAPTELSTHRGLRQPGAEAADGGWSEMIGLRVDGGDADALRWSLQAQRARSRYDEERASSLRPPLANRMRYDGAFLLGEARLKAAGGELRVLASVDRLASRDDILRDDQQVGDLDLQWSISAGAHDWSMGAGWRDYRSESWLPAGQPCNSCFGVWPPRGGHRITSLFVQDQWRPAPAWRLISGVKLEQHEPGRRNAQPTLRLAWTPSELHTVWAAASRAVRAPTRIERDRAAFNVPPAQAPLFGCRVYDAGLCLAGETDPALWKATVLEGGWRARLTPQFDLDARVFDSRYTGMPASGVDRQPQLQGLEASLRWQAWRNWQLRAHVSLHRGDEVRGTQGRVPLNLLPRSKLLLQSSWQPAAGFELDLRGERVGALQRANLAALPAYWRWDLRGSWQARPGWTWWASWQRLNQPAAVEYTESLKVNTVADRAVMMGVQFQP